MKRIYKSLSAISNQPSAIIEDKPQSELGCSSDRLHNSLLTKHQGKKARIGFCARITAIVFLSALGMNTVFANLSDHRHYSEREDVGLTQSTPEPIVSVSGLKVSSTSSAEDYESDSAFTVLSNSNLDFYHDFQTQSAEEAIDAACRNNMTHLRGKAYVKKGGVANGSGALGKKTNPYPSLAAAQGQNWKTLAVIPSTPALNDSIILQKCQRIVGEGAHPVKDPTGPVATIEGSTGADVITAMGNNVVKNLLIKNPAGNGISLAPCTSVPCSTASLSLRKLRIIGATTVTTNMNGWAIGGYIDNDGIIDIKESQIEETKYGHGIYFIARNTAVSTVRIMKTKVLNMLRAGGVGSPAAIRIGNNDASVTSIDVNRVTVRNDIGARSSMIGLHILPSAGTPIKSQAYVHINNSIFDGGPTLAMRNGLRFFTFGGLSAYVHHSTFKNAGINGMFMGVGGSGALTTPTSNLIVTDNTFDNIALYGLWADASFGPVQKTYLTFANNRLSKIGAIGNRTSPFPGSASLNLSADRGAVDATFHADIHHNTFENSETAVRFLASNTGGMAGIVHADIHDNKLTDVEDGVLEEDDIGFSELKVKYERNCHKNVSIIPIGPFPPDFVFTAGIMELGFNPASPVPGQVQIIDAGGGSLGSVGQNSFVGLDVDIIQVDAGGFADDIITAKNNYFDGGPAILQFAQNPPAIPFSPVLQYDPCASSTCGHNHNDGLLRDGVILDSDVDID